MKFTNVRNFLRDPKKYFNDLPVMITRYGKPIAIVIPPQVGVTSKGNAVALREVTEENDNLSDIQEFWVTKD